jgi:putative FmdB family regulatory protein
MPIYEYKCADCKRKVSLFFGSFSVAERRSEAGEIECPNCGSNRLERLMSRVNMVRGDSSLEDSMSDIDDGGDMDGMGGMLNGLDEDDPRSVARWARRMKDSMGGEMDMGPDFDQALARIEAGEDPDKVMEDMDPEAMGGMGDGDDESLGDLDDDFGSEAAGL